jgi:hypothetical protein
LIFLKTIYSNSDVGGDIVKYNLNVVTIGRDLRQSGRVSGFEYWLMRFMARIGKARTDKERFCFGKLRFKAQQNNE